MENSESTNFKNLVLGVDTQIPLMNNTFTTAINFDNAATTPPFCQVITDLSDFAPWYSAINRGKGYKSNFSTEQYENARLVVSAFVKADKEKDTVIFTKNATEAINLLADVLHNKSSSKNIILSSWMEHSANDLPWRNKFKVLYAEINKFGRLDMDALESKLKRNSGKIILVAITGASNVTGYLNPIYDIACLAHRYNAKILVDGAQLVPHLEFDMMPFDSPEHIDFLVFSAHKMYAPFGSGILIGPRYVFEDASPFIKGGGATKLVTYNKVDWDIPPARNEAGTPNLMGIMALASSIKVMKNIGMDRMYSHEVRLLRYCYAKLCEFEDVLLYTDGCEKRIGVIPFNIKGIHNQITSAILAKESGIAVRSGLFCAHPYTTRLLGYNQKNIEYFFKNPDAMKPGMVRISFGIYNDTSEVDVFISCIKNIIFNKNEYIEKYTTEPSRYGITNSV